jgi:hypothetical protein
MNPEQVTLLKKRIVHYQRGVKYLDSCGKLTLEKLLEARQIAGRGLREEWLRQMWEPSNIPAANGGPGGREQLRYDMAKYWWRLSHTMRS